MFILMKTVGLSPYSYFLVGAKSQPWYFCAQGNWRGSVVSPRQQNSEQVNTPVFPTAEFVGRHPGFVEIWAPQLPSITG